jgi:ABC-type transport system involved in multi-copper enzyme maturation permease subunit
MVLTIVRKELRETRAFAALALGFSVIYLGKQTGNWAPMLNLLVAWVPGMNREVPDVPFVQDNFVTVLFFIGAALAIALGFRQSAWEPSQGTVLYLFHLPLGRHTILGAKVLTGIALLLLCTLVPILIYAAWAAIPGTHPGPFEWSMTEPAFEIWVFLPLVYLGAFASGIRPGRWFGSRLLPLASVLVCLILLGPVPYWWLIAFPMLLVVAAVLVSDILWAADTRDF